MWMRLVSVAASMAFIASLNIACTRSTYQQMQLPNSRAIIPPWFSSFPAFPNSYGLKNLGTAYSPSTLFLSDNVADGGDIIAVAVNGQIILDNHRIHTLDNAPPYPLSIKLKPGPNQIDISCRQDPDGAGCTLKAEISNSSAGQGVSTINEQSIPEGVYASFIVEYKSASI